TPPAAMSILWRRKPLGPRARNFPPLALHDHLLAQPAVPRFVPLRPALYQRRARPAVVLLDATRASAPPDLSPPCRPLHEPRAAERPLDLPISPASKPVRLTALLDVGVGGSIQTLERPRWDRSTSRTRAAPT